jgi:NitT/TauT family transport system substrate-binding protein
MYRSASCAYPCRGAVCLPLGPLAITLLLVSAVACAAPAVPANSPTSQAARPVATSLPAPSAGAAAVRLTDEPASPPTLPSVSVGVLNTLPDAPILVAELSGYFREAGIQPDLVLFQSAAQMVAPLGAGQLDVGGGALSAGLHNAIARGIDLRIVADRSRENGFGSMIIRRDLIESGRVQSLADIRGLRYQRTAECISDEPSAVQFLATAGLTLQDVDVTLMPVPDAPAALANGSIDVAQGIEPFTTMVEQAGTGVTYHRYGYGAPVYRQLAVLLYSPVFIAKRELATSFMVAYLRGIRDYYEAFFGSRAKRDELVQLLIEKTPVKQRALYETMIVPLIDPNGELNRQSMSDDQEYYLGRGCQQQPIDLAQSVDTSFVDAAVARLGRYPRQP